MAGFYNCLRAKKSDSDIMASGTPDVMSAQDAVEDYPGKKKSKFQTFKNFFSKKKRKDTTTPAGESVLKLSQSSDNVNACEVTPTITDKDSDSGSKIHMGNKALSHDSVFVSDLPSSEAKEGLGSSQDSIPGRVKSLQLQLKQAIRGGSPPSLVCVRTGEDAGAVSEDDGLPCSPPEYSTLHSVLASSTHPSSHLIQRHSSLSMEGSDSDDDLAQVSYEAFSRPVSPLACVPVDFSQPANSLACLGNSAARHRIAVRTNACVQRRPVSRLVLENKGKDLRERVLLRNKEDQLSAIVKNSKMEGEENEVAPYTQSNDTDGVGERMDVQEESRLHISAPLLSEDGLTGSSLNQKAFSLASCEMPLAGDECVPDEGHASLPRTQEASQETPGLLEFQADDDFLLDSGCEVVSEEPGSLLQEVLSSLRGPLTSGLVLEPEDVELKIEVEDMTTEENLRTLTEIANTQYTKPSHPKVEVEYPVVSENDLLSEVNNPQEETMQLDEDEKLEKLDLPGEAQMHDDMQDSEVSVKKEKLMYECEEEEVEEEEEEEDRDEEEEKEEGEGGGGKEEEKEEDKAEEEEKEKEDVEDEASKEYEEKEEKGEIIVLEERKEPEEEFEREIKEFEGREEQDKKYEEVGEGDNREKKENRESEDSFVEEGEKEEICVEEPLDSQDQLAISDAEEEDVPTFPGSLENDTTSRTMESIHLSDHADGGLTFVSTVGENQPEVNSAPIAEPSEEAFTSMEPSEEPSTTAFTSMEPSEEPSTTAFTSMEPSPLTSAQTPSDSPAREEDESARHVLHETQEECEKKQERDGSQQEENKITQEAEPAKQQASLSDPQPKVSESRPRYTIAPAWQKSLSGVGTTEQAQVPCLTLPAEAVTLMKESSMEEEISSQVKADRPPSPLRTQSAPSIPLPRENPQVQEEPNPENPFGVRLRKTAILMRYTSEGESLASSPQGQPAEPQQAPSTEQSVRKPSLPKKPDRQSDAGVRPKRTPEPVEASESPSWISVARQKQRIFKENSLEETSASKHSVEDELNRKTALPALSNQLQRDQSKPIGSPVKAVSCSLEISKPALVEKDGKRALVPSSPAPLAQDEPPWLALAKKKAKAWSEMPQIVQ